MNLAWGGIVLVVLLLPGFLFFVGFYLPERFTRQLAERSTLGHLAGTVMVSLAVHALLFLLIDATCVTQCVRIDYLIEFITLSQPSRAQLDRLLPSIMNHVGQILGYVVLSGALGLGFGAIMGWAVVKGPMRRLAQHTWVYGLLIEEPDGLSEVCQWVGRKWPRLAGWPLIGRVVIAGFREVTLAHVLTRTEHGGRILLYRGYLKAFGIQSEGKFTYLVLVQPHRLYMELKDGEASTTPADLRHQITSSQRAMADGIAPSLYIEGSQIANVFFDRERLPNPLPTAEFEAIVADQERHLSESRDPEGTK